MLVLAASMGLAPVSGVVPVHAQTIDPSMLQALQRQLGSAAPSSQAPAAEPAPQNGEAELPGIAGGRVDTTEEQELRRAQARRDLAGLYQPSTIESDYRRRTQDRDLRQFGYDFLQSARPPSGTRSGAVGSDYVLGIGDELSVSFRGAVNNSFRASVDRDGRVVVGTLPPIMAAGRSLGEVRRQIAAETKRTMLATEAFVTVGDIRSISVFVGGEVERPGQISLNSLSDIGTAISMAGGVRRSGSLRRVRLVRAGGGTVSVDLYGLFGIGAPPAIKLRDGDRIIVPVIGPTVAVTGAVARPGIYELAGTSTAGSIIAYAGGAIRQRGAQIVVSRIQPDGSEVFERAATASSRILGGDAVQVVGRSAGGVQGRVTLLGNVDNPGPRPLAAATTVADLVGSTADLRPDTYLPAAVISRVSPTTGARRFEVINLSSALRNLPSPALRGDDQLYLFSRADIRFLNSAPVRQIILGGINLLPQCNSLVTLASTVTDTDSYRFSAATRGSLVVQSEQGATLGSIGGIRQAGNRVTQDDADLKRRDDREVETCPSVFESVPQLLTTLLEHSLSVGGSVRVPGAYPVGSDITAADIVDLAGGMVTGSRGVVLDINRTDGSSERVDAGSDPALVFRQTLLAAGDDIRFNAQQPVFESSAVLLSGEVNRPGLYSIRRGEKLSELLHRAGGLADQAYPYGAVFTRVSVKEAQQDGFKRTARELNNSLLAVAARSQQASAEGLAGAAALASTLANTEASGRMVVEADPRVLAIRPDLDVNLEAGDRIFIPKRPRYVIALGDVNNPGALQFVAGKNVGSYLSEAGGTLATADRGRVFVVLPNGTAQPVRGGGWSNNSGMVLPPGSTIIVPKNIDPLYKLSIIRDVTTIIAQLATSVATVAVLATR